MKIAIINTVLANTGDAAIAESEIKLCQDLFGQNTRFKLFDNLASAVRPYYPDLDIEQDPFSTIFGREADQHNNRWQNILLIMRVGLWLFRCRWQRRQLPKVIKDLAAADLIIATGGTWLIPQYPQLHKLFNCWLAVVLHRPLFFMPQTAGPFTKYRYWWRRVIKYSQLFMCRETTTQLYLKQLVRSKTRSVPVVPDVVWRYPPTKQVVPSSELIVGFTLRDWIEWPYDLDVKVGLSRYYQAVAQQMQHLVERYQAKIICFSTAQGIPEYYRNDAITAQRIKDLLPKKIQSRVVINAHHFTPDQYRAQVSQCVFLVTTRMHGAIMAWQSGVPVIAMPYQPKMDSMAWQMGAADLIAPLNNLSGLDLCYRTDYLLNNLVDIRKTVALAGLKLWRASSAIDRQLAQLLFGFPKRPVAAKITPQTVLLVRRSTESTVPFRQSDLKLWRAKGWRVNLFDCDRTVAQPPMTVTNRLDALPRPVREGLLKCWAVNQIAALAAELQHRPGVILAQGGASGLAAAIALQAVDSRARLIVQWHGDDNFRLLGEAGPNSYDLLAAVESRFVVPTRVQGNRLIELGIDRSLISVLPDSVSEKWLQRQPNRVQRTGPQLIAVGNLVERSGFDDAIRALALLRTKYPYLYLTVIGEGEQLAAWQKLAVEQQVMHRVRFTGSLSEAEISQLLQQGAVLLVPGKTAADGSESGQPVVLRVAMALGIPVIATAHSGIPELITNWNGWLAKPNNPASLADAIDGFYRSARRGRTIRLKRAQRLISRQIHEDYLVTLI